MRYLYPIRRSYGDYHFGITDIVEINVDDCCSEKCKHENPIEASDCFREYLLKKKPSQISVDPVKCCHPKCSNITTKAISYGYNFQFTLCENHQDKSSVRKVCGFGFPLVLREL